MGQKQKIKVFKKKIQNYQLKEQKGLYFFKWLHKNNLELRKYKKFAKITPPPHPKKFVSLTFVFNTILVLSHGTNHLRIKVVFLNLL